MSPTTPLVAVHGRALPATSGNVEIMGAGLRDPDAVGPNRR